MLTFNKYLHPLFGKLHELRDFSNVNSENQLEKEEYPILEKAVGTVGSKIDEIFSRLKQLETDLERQVEIVENETGDDKKDAVKVYNLILRNIEEAVTRLNREFEIINSPYFGKIVFNRRRSEKFHVGKVTSYIGKFAYFDPLTKTPLVTDWRAPIANLYYTNSGPTDHASFISPAGEQVGSIEQKRMFEISNSRFKNVYDAKTGNTAADQFLLSQLTQKIGQKLTDIVSTIQDEQNKIIRDNINKFIVLQGVAGSGKTTIVLHRLAFLFFSFQNEIRPERTLIIAPNKLFLDYISNVLPSLGIEGVEANTYLFWAKKVLMWDHRYILSSETPNTNIQKYKGSKEFLKLLTEYLEEYVLSVISDIPFIDNEYTLKAYEDVRAKHKEITYREAVKLAVQRTQSKELFKRKIIGTYMGMDVSSEEKNTKINQYLKSKFEIMTVYKAVVELMPVASDIKERTKKNVRKVGALFKYETEDIAPMVVLHFMLNGNVEQIKDYVIADEAQDLSYPQIYSLAMVAKKGNLMLAGDLAQAIKEPVNIVDWVDLMGTVRELLDPNLKLEYHQINKCYRTTIEIIDYVSGKTKPLFPTTYLKPEAVLRHGNEVQNLKLKIDNGYLSERSVKELSSALSGDMTANINTIAIITRTQEQANNLYLELKDIKSISNLLVPPETEDYKSGIIITPVIKAKGLEFDIVYVFDVSEDNYSYSYSDARLFYVASTRALHKLVVVLPENNVSSLIK